jgi:hypothetical protein
MRTFRGVSSGPCGSVSIGHEVFEIFCSAVLWLSTFAIFSTNSHQTFSSNDLAKESVCHARLTGLESELRRYGTVLHVREKVSDGLPFQPQSPNDL